MQKYVMVPAVWSVTLAEPPGEIKGVRKLPLLAAASCVVESLFTHVTVAPTDTVSGFGENAVVVRVEAPATIDTVVPDGGGVGVGVGVGEGAGAGFELPPQALRQSAVRRMRLKRVTMLIRSLCSR